MKSYADQTSANDIMTFMKESFITNTTTTKIFWKKTPKLLTLNEKITKLDFPKTTNFYSSMPAWKEAEPAAYTSVGAEHERERPGNSTSKGRVTQKKHKRCSQGLTQTLQQDT